jgi:hypothetical protein
METVFDDLLMKGVRAGHIPARSAAARTWYRSAASSAATTINMNDQKRTRSKVEPGSMYMYHYDPKTKDTLPFYDEFPLIFPIEPTKDGFYGLNLHYLPLKLRAQLMDALYKFSSDKKFDERTKLNFSYKLLKSAAGLNMYKPCLKRYLMSHVRSQFLYVFPSEWDTALFLPTARFKKATDKQVWDTSTKMIYGMK